MKLRSIRSKPFRFRGNNFTGEFSIVEIHGCVTRIHSRRDSKYFHDATYRITKALIPDFDRVLTVASRITATPMAEPPIGNASHSSALSLAEICLVFTRNLNIHDTSLSSDTRWVGKPGQFSSWTHVKFNPIYTFNQLEKKFCIGPDLQINDRFSTLSI